MYDGKMGQKLEVKKRGHNAAGGWYAVSVRHTGRYICSLVGGGGGAGALADQLGTDAWTNKKTLRKGTFFKLGSAERCYSLGSEKWHFSGKRVGFLKSDKKKTLWLGIKYKLTT